MTQEDKQLLLKDLCARLPYGVQVEIKPKVQEQFTTSLDAFFLYLFMTPKDDDIFDEFSIVPYLRPMSSMTEEELKTFCSFIVIEDTKSWIGEVYCIKCDCIKKYLDFVYSHHLDIHGFIKMGLALEAPEDMYKSE